MISGKAAVTQSEAASEFHDRLKYYTDKVTQHAATERDEAIRIPKSF
jgi:hypothetical protein